MFLKINPIKLLKRAVGGDALRAGYYSFLLVHTSFLVSVRLPGVFINTLLLGESNDINVVMMFNLMFFLTGAVSMLAAVPVLHRTNPGFVAIVGIAGYNVLYLVLILLLLKGRNVSDFHLVLAALMGVSDGFYWLAYGNLLSDTTELKNRDSGVAIIGICMSVVNLTAPLLAGWIIVKGGTPKGYLMVFIMAFIVSVITAVLAIRLPKKHAPEGNRAEYVRSLRLAWQNEPLRYALLAQGSKGIREGVFTFILSIILYQMISNEWLIGVNNFVGAVVSIISFTLMSRLLTHENRLRYMALAAAVLSAAAAVCLFQLNVVMIFIFTILNSLFAGFIENSCYSNLLDRLQNASGLDNHRPEMFAFNECALVLGRSIGIAIILLIGGFFGNSLMVQMVSLLILSVTQFVTVGFCKKSVTVTQNQKGVVN
jgi:YQGE family putative transporter